VSSKEKYKNIRNALYGLKERRNNSKQLLTKTEAAQTQVEDIEDKSKKGSFRSVSDHHSLKDTMSTEGSKTLQLIHENMSPFFSNAHLADFDLVALLGKGRLGQVCMVRYILKNKDTREQATCSQ